jgi:flagellar hook-length control protein FliK
VAAPVAGETPAAAGGAELQLAALQSAFAKLESADGAATATDPALAAATEGEAAGFSLAAGVQPGARESADLRSLQQTAQAAVQADAGKPQQGVQARESAQTVAGAEAPAPSVTQLQAQAAKLETVPNPAAVPGDRIPARVGTQAWDNQVSQRIVYMVGKEQAATLTLNPPDLGPVQVVLNVSNDGASVAFSSSQQEVRQALENALPRLREMMGESGIALGNATVDAGVADQRQAQQDGERRNHGGNGAGHVAGATGSNDDSAARPVARTVKLGDSGLVDTFA